jgi:hypothetical protein
MLFGKGRHGDIIPIENKFRCETTKDIGAVRWFHPQYDHRHSDALGGH